MCLVKIVIKSYLSALSALHGFHLINHLLGYHRVIHYNPVRTLFYLMFTIPFDVLVQLNWLPIIICKSYNVHKNPYR